MIHPRLSFIALTLVLTLGGGAASLAADETPSPLPLIKLPAAPAKADAVQSDEALAALSGGANTSIALTDQDLTAINTGNQITAGTVGSGSISLDGSALSGFSGIGNFIMNTGHNNNLQSTLSVTVIVTQ